jgi:hypothetical protein
MNAYNDSSHFTAEEIIRRCRAEIEYTHNLQYLITADADNPHLVRRYSAMLGEQLGTLTDLLCRRTVKAETLETLSK